MGSGRRDYIIEFEDGTPTKEGATVVISLYNYETHVTDALNSVAAQTTSPLSLVVVDDSSKDDSASVCRAWLADNSARFSWALMARHMENEGLSRTRNLAFSLSVTEHVFVLDADNELYPRCVERSLEVLADTDAAFVYPILEVFGDKQGLQGKEPWSREKLAVGNYIDAMAMVRKSRWEAVGGYETLPYGWEDFDLWCKFAEKDWWGLRIPEILARYRVHGVSMLRQSTNRRAHLDDLFALMKSRHPWLNLSRIILPGETP